MPLSSLFKKKDPREVLKQLIKNLNRAKFKIDFKLDSIEEQLKDYYLSNKVPPPTLIQGWKTMNNMQKFIDNQIAGFENQIILSDLSHSLKDALGVKKIKVLFKRLTVKPAGWDLPVLDYDRIAASKLLYFFRKQIAFIIALRQSLYESGYGMTVNRIAEHIRISLYD